VVIDDRDDRGNVFKVMVVDEGGNCGEGIIRGDK
jgi:hypothetical protein